MHAKLQSLAAALLLANLSLVSSFEIGSNAPIDLAGIKRNDHRGFDDRLIAVFEDQVAFAPNPERHEKNNSIPVLQDRSAELVRRQSCPADYWYCPGFGKCCPRSQNCCSYGYCIDPAATCCPAGPCQPGYKCCSTSTCSPPGAECCSDGNYCSAGNVCVKLFDTGRIVCCTDLKCTAAVVSGTTTYRSLSTAAPGPSASITRPPTNSQVIVDSSYTWYWTVTWWYLSFYYTTQSTVTYTTKYYITTYTTTAADVTEASSRFAALSASLTFNPPADATALASAYRGQAPTRPSLQANVGSTKGPQQTTTNGGVTTRINVIGPGNTSGPGGASSAAERSVAWALMAIGTLSGALMIYL